MITAIHRRKLFPLLAMLIALAGMTFSAIGEASSHGIAELTELGADHQDGHPHSHDFDSHDLDNHDTGEQPGTHLHHDSGNHTHESADRLTVHIASDHEISLRQLVPFAGDSPHSFRYRLDRPPKAALTV